MMNEAELVVQYDRMIHRFTNKMVCNYESSDVCLDRDDILQIGRMYVLEAIRQYDPNRGAKLTTFVFLKLFTKFANMGRNFKGRNKRGTMSMSMLERDTLEEDSGPMEFGGVGSEDSFLNYLDTATSIERELTQFERVIFDQFFIEGFTSEEIFTRHPGVSEGRILQAIADLSAMFGQGGFDERKAEGRIGKGWFDSPFIESGLPYDGQTLRLGVGRGEAGRGSGDPGLCVPVEHEAQEQDADQQLLFQL